MVERAGFESFGKEAAAAGEPWKSFFQPADMAAKLAASRFADIEDSGSDAMAARYFAGRADGLTPTGPMRFVRGADRGASPRRIAPARTRGLRFQAGADRPGCASAPSSAACPNPGR